MQLRKFQIGEFSIATPIILAPMAGVTDQPFRQLCRKLGAGLTVTEMVASQANLRNSKKSSLRTNHAGEPRPRVVQILGNDPQQMAEAAQYNVNKGADIIDINMGCPAKKVCRKAAGSALLADPKLIQTILTQVVAAVKTPVTLKIRTGVSEDARNAVEIATIAESCGIQSLAIHGRTREDKFNGDAEYDTIAAVKAAVGIPIVANGDINSPEKALDVLQKTQADAIMIGRGAQGHPWIFREIAYYLETGKILAPPSLETIAEITMEHIHALHQFYPEAMSARIARKHIQSYNKWLKIEATAMQTLIRIENPAEQLRAMEHAVDTILNTAATA